MFVTSNLIKTCAIKNKRGRSNFTHGRNPLYLFFLIITEGLDPSFVLVIQPQNLELMLGLTIFEIYGLMSQTVLEIKDKICKKIGMLSLVEAKHYERLTKGLKRYWNK